MRNLLSRLLVVALLLVACSGIVWGDGLKVTITKKGGGTETKKGQASLQEAFNRLALKEVVGIKVSAGNFTEADWNWLKTNRNSLTGLKKFEVTDAVGSVADIPNSRYGRPYFGAALEVLSVAKLQAVGEHAFQECDGLTSVSLPSATKIGKRAFYRCRNLATISLPAVSTIVDSAFYDCSGLKKLQLGATPPTSVGEKPFFGCPLARELELIKPDGNPLTDNALDHAKDLYKAAEDGDKGDNLWYGWAFEKIPSSNLSGTIDGVAFSGAASLEAAMQGKDLKNVKKLTITGGTFQVSDWVFLREQGKDELQIAQFTIDSSVTKVADLPDLPEESPLYLPAAEIVRIEKVQKVGANAFCECLSLTKVSLPAATNIGGQAFILCENLESVPLPAATNIGNGAFEGCTSLTSVSLPAATDIDADAFGSCGNLQLVSLPAVTNIGDRAFLQCVKLKTLQLGATPPSNVGKETFTGCPLARELQLIKSDGKALTGSALSSAKDRYKGVNDGDTGDNLWYGWAFKETPSSNLSGTIDDVQFTNAASLEVAMQGKVLKNVKKLTITGGTFQVSDWDYLREQGKGSLKIEQFTIDSSVTKVADIPDLSYESPRYLPSAQIVRIAKVQKVGVYVFRGCTSLTSVSLPSATNMGLDAFSGCTSLTSVSLPVATIIGQGAFKGCTSLTRVLLPAAADIGAFAFQHCEKLEDVSLPVATKASYQVFNGCKNLKSVSLPKVADIAKEAFIDCSSLNTLKLGATPPTSVEEQSFTGCPFARELELIKPDGNPLTGKDLDNAKKLYKAAEDGDKGDNFWYGWALEKIPSCNLSGTIDGVAFTNAASLEAAMQGKDLKNVKKLTITGGTFQVSDWGYLREQGKGSLKIEQFTIDSSATNVADIPNLPYYSPRYLPSAQIVRIERVQKVGANAFHGCTSLTSVSLPVATNIGNGAFSRCVNLTSVSLPVATNIGNGAFRQCVKLKTLQLGSTPPTRVDAHAFDNCPAERTLIITDAMGVPLEGTELESAAAKYDRKEGAPNDGKWYGWTIKKNPPITLSVIVEPAGAGTAKITRKASGAVVNVGDALTKGEVLIVKGETDGTHEVKKITAVGATNTSGNEWKVDIASGKVTFTVEFEKKPEEEGGNNNNNDPTPVESVLLSQVQLSPNPTGGLVTVDAGTAIARCEVYSSTGALLQTIEAPESVFTIDLTASPSGVYLVRLVDMQGGCKTLRVVKQ